MNKVSELYNSLYATQNIYSKKSIYPIHKAIYIRGVKTTIPELIKNENWIEADSKILDAGCGNGYSLFYFQDKLNCLGVGLSLSINEVESANNAVQKKGLEDYLSFDMASYDLPIERKFDVIIAIESLKHSENLERSISNMERCLNPGGIFIVSEDLISEAVLPDKKYMFYKKSWSIKNAYTEKDYMKAFKDFKLFKKIDLSYTMKQNSPSTILFKYKFLKLLSKLPVIGKYFRIFAGGLVQDLYYATNKMTYCLFCFIKL